MTLERRWLLLLFLGVVFALYWPALQTLSMLWRDTDSTTYTHGWLIAALCVWLLCRSEGERYSATTAPDGPRLRMFFALALASAVVVWQIAYRAGIQFGYLMLLPPLAYCAVRCVLGAGDARRAAFPLVFLYFALPLWDYLNPLVHAATIHAVRLMLRLVGVPAFFSGDTVSIPAGTFAIEDGCSGLHFVIVALAIAALVGEMREDGWRLRVRWLAIALVLAVITNWIRVFSIILLGHFTLMQNYIVRVSHYWYGWALFAVTLLAFFLIERRVPVQTRPDRAPRPVDSTTGRSRAATAAACAVVALPALINPIIHWRGISNLESLARPPQLAAGWRAVPPGGAWLPVQTEADLERHWHFTNGDADVEVFAAWYREQAQRKKLGGFANRPAGDAEVLDVRAVTEQGQNYAAQRVEEQGEQSLLWLRYRVADREFVSATGAQLWYSIVALTTLSSPPSSVWAIRAPCRPDCAAARSMLARAVQQGEGTL